MNQIRIDTMLGPGLISRAIAWDGLGFGGYSHQASLLADGRYLDAHADRYAGTWTTGPHTGLYETVPAGVHIRDPHWERSVRRVRQTFDVTQTEYDDWEGNLRAKIGTPYSLRSIAAFVDGQNATIKGHWICSMLALNALQHVRIIKYPLSVPAHQISPNMSMLLIEQAGAPPIDVQPQYLGAA